jgi:hypothetical protein
LRQGQSHSFITTFVVLTREPDPHTVSNSPRPFDSSHSLSPTSVTYHFHPRLTYILPIVGALSPTRLDTTMFYSTQPHSAASQPGLPAICSPSHTPFPLLQRQYFIRPCWRLAAWRLVWARLVGWSGREGLGFVGSHCGHCVNSSLMRVKLHDFKLTSFFAVEHLW